MSQQTIRDEWGRFRFEIEVDDPVLEQAIDHYNAEDVLKCAILMALSVLAEAGPWPGAALESMSDFMSVMKDRLVTQHLI
jgi:hypothetical protein